MSRGMQEKAESETNVQSWSWNKIPLFALNPQNRKKLPFSLSINSLFSLTLKKDLCKFKSLLRKYLCSKD
jgi:hypothetical protein